MSLLDVRDLTVTFTTPDGMLPAVRRLSFAVEPGRTLAVVGESGAGKSAAMLALLGLSGGRVTGRPSSTAVICSPCLPDSCARSGARPSR